MIANNNETVTLEASILDDFEADGSLIRFFVTEPINYGGMIVMTRIKVAEATVSSGSASASYTVPSSLATGEHDLYAVLEENTKYETAEGESTIHIRHSTVTTTSNMVVSIGEEVTFTAQVKYNTSQNVNEGTVQFVLGGSNIGSPVSVSNGVATLNYTIPSNTQTGASIVAKFIQTDNYAASQSSGNTITLRKDPTVAVQNVSANRSGTASITASVEDGEGTGINTGSAVLQIDGTQVGSAVNVTNGSVTFSYSVPANATLGSHAIKVVYQKNQTYNSAYGTASLIVRTPTSLTPVDVSVNKGGTCTVIIQVKDNNNAAVTSGTVNITVGTASPVGATVNSSGEASITYTCPANASGTVNFSGSYVENTNYMASTTSTDGVITVRKGVTISVPSKSAVLGQSVTLQASLTDEDSSAVTSGHVDFEID